MAGFIRRFDYNPGTEVISQIEGLVIIDNPQPGAVQGASTGVACLIGEFPDVTYGVSVDGSGLVTTRARPVQIFSPADLQIKVGVLDPTLGDFGLSCGNGHAELANKTFSQLVVVPINIASGQGVRLFRVLPPCASVTNASPFVPLTGGVVQAGTSFRASSGIIKTAKRVVFTDLQPITTGVGGTTVAALSAATQTFTAAPGFDWAAIVRPDGTLGARKGDVLVIGSTDGSALSVDQGTYRVSVTPGAGVNIVVEMMNGTAFPWVGVTPTPWRLHFSSDADTAPVIVVGSTTPGGYDFNDAGGANVPARPITDSTGAVGGAVAYGILTLMTPVTAPTALSATFWDPLSGLSGLTHPTVALAYTAAIQQPNAPSVAGLDTLYGTCIAALVSEQLPGREVDLLWCARKSATIRSLGLQHVLTVNQRGISRLFLVSPPLSTVTVDTAGSATYPGVAVSRNERQIYAWPGVQTLIDGTQDERIKRADGTVGTSGVQDTTFDGWVASLLSVLRPELDAGQAGPPVPATFAAILGYQSGLPVELGIDQYIFMKQLGICGYRLDRTSGSIIQSSVTTSLLSGQTTINRRRMADFIEDSLAQALVQFVKNIASQENRDSAVAEVVSVLDQLRSQTNPANQRIQDYSVDDKSGNTPDLEAQGIFAIVVKVRMLPIDRFIVLNVQVGESVQISTQI
jgi:hypothetical protein